MAEFNNKFADNVGIGFFVDDQCIACDACVVEAPETFRMNKIDGHAYCYNQTTNLEISSYKKALEAIELCPVEAIGIKD